MDPSASADPPARNLRAEYARAMRRCTPKQRIWLRTVREMAGQKWAARARLGYSTRTIQTWLRLPLISQVLSLQAEMAELDSDLTSERIQREYERLGFSSLKQFYRDDGSLKTPTEWTEDQAAAVQEYYFDASGEPRIKLHNKPLDAIAKIRRLMVERHEVTGPGGKPIPHAHTIHDALKKTTDPNEAMSLYSELVKEAGTDSEK